MRVLLLLCLLLGACAGSQPAAKTADESQAYADRTRERWEREEEQRQIEQRRNAYTGDSPGRGAGPQPQ